MSDPSCHFSPETRMKTVAMSGSSKRVQNAIIVGGGIGGLAAALALARQGISVDLLEAASEIGEIGAGIPLAAHSFNRLDALGVGEATAPRARGAGGARGED